MQSPMALLSTHSWSSAKDIHQIRLSRGLQASCGVLRAATSHSRRSGHRLSRGILQIRNSLDYVATASDDGVLRMPARSELNADQIRKVFGYPRNLHDKYRIGKMLGAGSFGVVRECFELSTGKRYAIKTIGKLPKRGPPTPRYLLKLRTEVEVMNQLGSSLNAVNLKDVFEDDINVHLVMELCEGGALLERVESTAYSERYIAKLVRSILRFISQCHAKGIIYRDVKPDNFLFLTKEENSPLKATDFGLSIRHLPEEPKLTSRSGTPAYMAPELVMQCYDEKADIWSVGMLAYQLLTGKFPFWEDVRNESLMDVWKAILAREVVWSAPELQALSRDAVDFLERLLQRNPIMRPSAAEALAHPWLKDDVGNVPDTPMNGSVVQRLQRFATYSHLKQVVLKMITEDMDVADIPAASPLAIALKEMFATLDKDSNGQLSFEEMAAGLKAQGYVVSEDEVKQLMEKLDMDHDGTVHMSEFLTTMIDWSTLAQSDEAVWDTYIERAFKRMDLDGDGYISLDELVQELPPAVICANSDDEDERLAEAKKMLREADTNGDGKISRQEFTHLLKDSCNRDDLSLYDDRLAVNALLDSGELAGAAH